MDNNLSNLFQHYTIQNNINKYLDNDKSIYLTSKSMYQYLNNEDIYKNNIKHLINTVFLCDKDNTFDKTSDKISDKTSDKISDKIIKMNKSLYKFLLLLNSKHLFLISKLIKRLDTSYPDFNMKPIFVKFIKLFSPFIKDIQNHDIPYIVDLYLLVFKSKKDNNNRTLLKYIKLDILDKNSEKNNDENSEKIFEKDKIIKAAIYANPNNLKYLDNHDLPYIEELYKYAIDNCPESFRYMKNHQVSNIDYLYDIASKKCGGDILKYFQRFDLYNIQTYIKHCFKYKNVCRRNSIKYLENPEPYLPMIISHCWSDLQYLPDKYHYHSITRQLYDIAIKKCLFSVAYIKNFNLFSDNITDTISDKITIKKTDINKIITKAITKYPNIVYFIQDKITHLPNLHDLYKIYIKDDVGNLEYINKSYHLINDLYLFAINIDPYTLKYIPDHSIIQNIESVYIKAVQTRSTYLVYIKNHNVSNIQQIYKCAIYSNPISLAYIKNHNVDCIEQLYTHAVSRNGLLLRFITNYNLPNIRSILTLALQNNGLALKYLKNHSLPYISDLYITAINSTPKAFEYIKNHSLPNIIDIYNLALSLPYTYTKQDAYLTSEDYFIFDDKRDTKYIKFNFPESILSEYLSDLYLKAVKINGLNLQYITNHDINNIYNIYFEAISNNPNSIQYIKNHFCENIGEIYKIAILKDYKLLKYIENHFVNEMEFIYLHCFKKDISLIQYFNNYNLYFIFNKLIPSLGYNKSTNEKTKNKSTNNKSTNNKSTKKSSQQYIY